MVYLSLRATLPAGVTGSMSQQGWTHTKINDLALYSENQYIIFCNR